MGRKKILIGCIFALTLILLMPSIPAIEQKTIEDKVYSDLVEKLKDFDFVEWQFPILTFIVQLIIVIILWVTLPFEILLDILDWIFGAHPLSLKTIDNNMS